jgi:hypothetical protein
LGPSGPHHPGLFFWANALKLTCWNEARTGGYGGALISLIARPTPQFAPNGSKNKGLRSIGFVLPNPAGADNDGETASPDRAQHMEMLSETQLLYAAAFGHFGISSGHKNTHIPRRSIHLV